MTKRRIGLLSLIGGIALGGLLYGCSYRYYAGQLEAMDESYQPTGMKVADDGTVTFAKGRLEISVKPMTDETLNRQFAAESQAGSHSTNPYTFGTSEYWAERQTPQRFTIFNLKVKNYEYPKVYVDPRKITIRSKNGRVYGALTFDQFDFYYRAYAIGYRGNEYAEYDTRKDILRRTLYPGNLVFSGQEEEGYTVFEVLHPDVDEIKVHIEDVALRYNYLGEPLETTDVDFFFKRDIGHIYPDGRMVRGKI